MKNLKKVLALVVVFTMMLSTVAFAAYPDVDADADYATAVEVLSALKVLQGDDQGNFNPDANITRAEFAAVVCRALGLENSANGAKGATAFADVAADHWATGYINLANQMGIINGMGDGTFAPEANVTFEQAVKMLVCSLGFEYMAQTKGGYPTGYLVVANQYGITDGVKATASEAASRSVVAELTYNALDCPTMEQYSYGTEEEWLVYDGLGTGVTSELKTILSGKLDVAKLSGVITSNEKVAINSDVKAEKGEIKFLVTEDVKTKFEEDFDKYDSLKAKVADSNADALVGNKVDLYITETSRNVWEVIAAIPEDGKNIVTTFASSDVNAKSNANIIYYDEEGKNSPTKLEVASDAYLVINNEYKLTYDIVGEDEEGEEEIIEEAEMTIATFINRLENDLLGGRVKAIDWDNDYEYDVVFLDAYKHAIVKNVNASSGMIRTENYGNIDLKFDDEDVIVTINDVNGNAVAVEDIAAGDVLAIICDTAAFSDFEVLDITVIPNASATVTGTIDEINIDDREDLAVTDKVYVDGVAYGLSVLDGDSRIMNFAKIDANSVGTFYLTLDGKIIGFDGDKVANGDYAFILDSGITTSGIGAGDLQLKVLTAKGEIATYTVANNVTIPNNGDEDVFSIKVADPDGDDTIGEDSFPADAFDDTVWADYNSDNVRATLEALGTPDASDLTERFVKIKLNSANKITRIEIPGIDEDFDINDDYDDEADPAEYKSKGNKIGNAVLADSAVIFVLDSDEDYTESTVKTAAEAFVNENKYAGYMYSGNETGSYEAALITYSGAKIPAEDGVAIVTSVTTISTADGDDAKKVRFIQNGSEDEKVITIVEGKATDLTGWDGEAATSKVSDVDDITLAVGDVFVYTANDKGVVDSFATVATRTEATYALSTYATTGANAEDEDVEYVYGYITDINGDIVEVEGTKYVIGDDANQYYFKHISSKDYKLEAGSWWAGKVDEVDTTEEGDKVSYVLIKLYDKDVTDIIALDHADGRVLIPAEEEEEE